MTSGTTVRSASMFRRSRRSPADRQRKPPFRQQQNRGSTCSAKKPSKPGATICVQTLKEPEPDPFPSGPPSFTVGKLYRSTLCQTAGLIFSRNRIGGNRQRPPEEPELSERAHQRPQRGTRAPGSSKRRGRLSLRWVSKG